MTDLQMLGLAPIDIAFIGVYFVAVFWIAVRARKQVRTQEDFFMGGRRFGKLIQTFAAFGQATSVENVSSTTTVVNTNGAAGIWQSLASGLANMPIFWMTSVWYRRMRLLTMADFFEERFGSMRMAAFYALCQVLYMVLAAVIGLTAMSKTVAAITAKPVAELTRVERLEYDQAVRRESLEALDFASLSPGQQGELKELQLRNPQKQFSYVNRHALIVVVAAAIFIYANIGGLAAAYLVDVLQGVLILVLTLILIPFAIARINDLHGGNGLMGALHSMHQVLPSSFLEMWGSPSLVEFTWYWIAAFSALGVVNIAVQASQMTACGSAKDEYTARFGFVSGLFLKRYATLIWGFVALLTVVLYGGAITDPDFVWGHATRDLLGPLGVGLVGLMIASLLAALMAAKSSYMLTTAALITRNLYQPFRPGRSEAHYLRAGRLFGAAYIILSVVVAMQFSDLFGLAKLVIMFNCVVAASFWLGVLWRRANRAGAWASMLVMFAVTVVLPFGLPLLPGMRTAPKLLLTTEPQRVSRTYIAGEMDVSEREKAIAEWKARHHAGVGSDVCPAALHLGRPFEKVQLLPAKSVFWSEGIKFDERGAAGVGYLKVDLVLLSWAGLDLRRNSYAFNETLTALFRLIVPVGILMAVSWLTPSDDRERLAQFYGKMRTPVRGTLEDDEREMALTRADPTRFDHTRLFPRSQWEFGRWNREDWLGVTATALGASGVVVLLIVMIRVGA